VITCEDWRNAPPEDLDACYRIERTRWIRRLQWDAEHTHRLLEGARLTGHAPGVLARDASGAPVGWAYYLLNHRTLQIGGLVAHTGEATRALLDAVLRSPEADMAAELRCFAFPVSNALESALVRRRFDVRRHLYLSRPLVPFASAAGSHAADNGAAGTDAAGDPQAWRLRSRLSITHWQEDEAVSTVRLLARAYAGVAGARCFAPNGRLDEWGSYLAQIIKLAAVGRFLPSTSLRATFPGDGDLAGALLATDLGTGAAHVAQLLVDPSARRRGVARDLIETACGLATAAGFRQMTLIVAEDNQAARALYAAAGFSPLAHFVHALRSAPTRVRSVRQISAAPAAAGRISAATSR
jgi:ribosomal protein S18 acetylase RimI-like enzyme